MKIEKFNENANDEYYKFKNEVKKLFFDLWDESLGVSSFDIDTTVKYNLTCNINYSISDNNFDYFQELFLLLKKSNSEFKLLQNKLYVNITNFKQFIDDMKLLLESKKFNL